MDAPSLAGEFALQEKGEQSIFTFFWYSEQLRHIFYPKPLKMLLNYQLTLRKGGLNLALRSLSMSQPLSQNKANCSLSAFEKENLIEFLLDLLYYIYNYYVAMLLISYGLYVTCQLTPLSHMMTVTCDSMSHDLI